MLLAAASGIIGMLYYYIRVVVARERLQIADFPHSSFYNSCEVRKGENALFLEQ